MGKATGSPLPSNWRSCGNCSRNGGHATLLRCHVRSLWDVAQGVWICRSRRAMAKLLLAEDDEFSRDMLARRLERSGHRVLPAADGREAVRVARVQRPDLILMDLDMPVMDG